MAIDNPPCTCGPGKIVHAHANPPRCLALVGTKGVSAEPINCDCNYYDGD